jgi:hypothetical protein
MRGFATGVLYALRTQKPLAIRGGAMRTFGSLAAFVTLAFLYLGIFLIQELFANPLESQSVALFAAAFILAIALLLLCELLQLPRAPLAKRNARPHTTPGARYSWSARRQERRWLAIQASHGPAVSALLRRSRPRPRITRFTLEVSRGNSVR